MSDLKTMNKSQKNRTRRRRKKAKSDSAEAKSDSKEMEKLELKNDNPFVKSVSVGKETKELDPQSKKEYMQTALSEAQRLWNTVKKKSKDPAFIELPDKDKIESVSLEFHAFHKEFPIVSRYLVCMGQYSTKAFKRYLIKVQNFKQPEERDKGYMEDQWVRRQADYVRYLWESYQRGHYNNSEAQNVWQEAYQTLKKEFIDFKNMHDDIEKDLELEKKKNKNELIGELFKRLSSGDQSLEQHEMTELLEVMKIQLFQQRKEKLTKQIKELVPLVEASCEATGTVEPTPEAPLPTPGSFLK